MPRTEIPEVIEAKKKQLSDQWETNLLLLDHEDFEQDAKGIYSMYCGDLARFFNFCISNGLEKGISFYQSQLLHLHTLADSLLKILWFHPVSFQIFLQILLPGSQSHF